MSRQEADDFLASGTHKGTAILSVSRAQRGPLSVPLAFRWTGTAFDFDTKPSRRHARAFMQEGRATALVHYERYGPPGTLEQYVMAEGPIAFVGGPPADPDQFGVARLTPETLIAVEYS